jgi:hypothetical protein
MRNKVKGMTLLARIEEARENRRRVELRDAEETHAEAAAHAEDTALVHSQTCEQRQSVLLGRYQTIRGVRSDADIQGLRSTERILAQRREKAAEAQRDAEAKEREAFVAAEQARETLQEVSLRRLRRSRMADRLRQDEKRATMMAEEEALSDELTDRFRGAETA